MQALTQRPRLGHRRGPRPRCDDKVFSGSQMAMWWRDNHISMAKSAGLGGKGNRAGVRHISKYIDEDDHDTWRWESMTRSSTETMCGLERMSMMIITKRLVQTRSVHGVETNSRDDSTRSPASRRQLAIVNQGVLGRDGGGTNLPGAKALMVRPYLGRMG